VSSERNIEGERKELIMPPHCDSLDGPVVTAARDALAQEDVDLILPFVKKDGEPEVRAAFDLAVKVRSQAPRHDRSRIDSFSRPRYACIVLGRAHPLLASSPLGSTSVP
jgi:hypothetical protein